RRGIPVFQRAQVLGELMDAKRGIAVAGTHGKTTTTSMIAHAMSLLGMEPTYVVGGELNDVGSNARCGSGEWLIAEADESDGSLVHLKPEIAVVTNIELDHHSHYSSVDEVVGVFEKRVGGLPPEGSLVIWDEPLLRKLAASTGARVATYGVDDGAAGAGNPDLDVAAAGGADYRALDVAVDKDGTSFKLSFPGGGRKEVDARLLVRGRHNVLNALAAVAVLHRLGVEPGKTLAALAKFSGTARRFQVKGEALGITIVDDYAHHPTEIKMTLEAARAGGWKRIIAAFQPHLYSRTRYLHDEFGRALNLCDFAVITDVFGAREEPEPGISGKLVVDSALKWGPGARVAYIPKLHDMAALLLKEIRPGDLVLTIGAGDIFKVGDELLGALERQARIA
ncbi:MAG: UDP-N-acetylmuramate--L-alanine ligase, partial [Actinomycetota bacterium]